jgi:alpha-L-fucosidase
VESLRTFGDLLRRTFAVNLARGATFTASNVRGKNSAKFGPAFLTDGDRYSYWATDDAVLTPELVVDMKKPTVFNVIRLRENIKLGQRISAFTIEAFADGVWKKIGEGTSVGANRLIRLPQHVVASKVRLRITGSAACIALSDFGLFREPAHLATSGEISVRQLGLSKSGWKVMGTIAGSSGAAIDEDERTLWSTLTRDSSVVAQFPQDISIDMGKVQAIKAFTYLPRQDKKMDGIADRYVFYTSDDGTSWVKAAEGEFSNIRANPIEQVVSLDHPVSARYFKLSILRVVAGNGVTAAEVGVRVR